MKIRKVVASDLDAVMEIVDAARGIMRASGNMRQWTGGYPDKTVMTADIDRGVCYGCEDGGKLSAVFSMIPGPDPTYADIYGGAWLNEEPYLGLSRNLVGINFRHPNVMPNFAVWKTITYRHWHRWCCQPRF